MAGNITTLLMEGEALPSRATAYGYDALDRLTSVSVYTNLRPTAYSLSTFSYDLADNRTNATHNGAATGYTLGVGDRLAATSDCATYLYNAAGCVTNIASVLPVPSVVNLHWNSQYQLTASYTNGILAESYQYDALSRRISTTSGGITTYHVYDDNWQVVADLDASGNALRSYTWAPGIDQLLAMTTFGATSTNTYFALTDHLGTVHALVDASGAIAESYEYDAWGNVLAIRDASGTPISNRQSAIGNRYLFQGREYSFSTGLYHFRHRWYEPVTGRWLSNDPIGISGGLNQYSFCANDPMNSRDSFGLCAESRYDERMQAIDEAQALFGPIMRFLTRPYFNALRSGVQTMYEAEQAGYSPETSRELGTIQGTSRAVSHDAFVYATALSAAGGSEISLGRNARVAPFGNRTGHQIGRYPHYHRRGVGPDGVTRPGQGIGRHRPWETKPTDTSPRDRF